ncbi:hypothetical protein PG993_001000 [Apiospora rasikravindrae]|uniref:Uncharacterized protein n=1 Tax=Apiospora rasikravindrae TaxID=990691 RepID=A0ABR1UCT9_9PEZI
MSAPEVSHGRGGAGNINPDSTQYVDGEITRQGEEGSQNAGPYSTGRGGGGNIGEPGKEPGLRTDKDVIPAAATRKSEEEPFHTGRGGAANVHLVADDDGSKKNKKVADSSLPAAEPQTSTADKLKHKIFGMFKK